MTSSGTLSRPTTHPPDTEVVFTADAAAEVSRLVRRYDAARVLVVATDGTVARTGLLAAFPGIEVRRFAGFTANPQLDDVLVGCRLRAEMSPDLILGIGGGSAMDTAKLVRLLPPDRAEALRMLRTPAADEPPYDAGPLVVVATTAGTGAEVTQFATVYCDSVKLSLDRPTARPDVAVLCPDLTASCPPPVTASCALDALAHALESLWSLRSTAESRFLAQQAGEGLTRSLALGLPTDRAARTELCRLALQAGLAINRTRTTIGHAFAYPLTMRFGIPHGLACALCLSWLLPIAVADRHTGCRDPRGVDFVERRLTEMAQILGVGSAEETGTALRGLITAAGFSPRLSDYGVISHDVSTIVAAALASQRSGNSPIALDPAVAETAMRRALGT